MAVWIKFQGFIEALAEKKHDLGADTFYIQLMNTEPSLSADFVETDLPADLSTAGGYTAGGLTCGTAVSSAQTAGVYKLCIADLLITATAAGIGPFRYVVLFNYSATNKDLISYADYGTPITLADTETFTVDFDAVNGGLTLGP
jgi:hypothetical protein